MTRIRQAAANNRVVRLLYRLTQIFRSRGAIIHRPRQSLRYVFKSQDVMHFTYELANEAEMASCVSEALGVPPARITELFDELRHDEWLHRELAGRLEAHPRRDDAVRYGYRLATYAIVRLTAPRVAAELGTHDGLQTAMLLRALERNAGEGGEGKLLSFDLNRESGWLVPAELRPRLVHVVGDLTETLGPALHKDGVGFLMQDIGHGWDGNRNAYLTAARAARGTLHIFAEVDSEVDLLEVASELGGRYTSFAEQPLDHFWHGQRWGLATLERRAEA
jgi:hypothetical protein